MGLEYVGGEESEGEGLTMVCLSSRVYRYRAKAIQVTNSSLPFILDFGAYCLEKKKKTFDGHWVLEETWRLQYIQTDNLFPLLSDLVVEVEGVIVEMEPVLGQGTEYNSASTIYRLFSQLERTGG